MKPAIEDKIDFETQKEIMVLYSTSARSFIQLSSGALALTIVFSEKVLGVKAPLDTTGYLVATWIMFLLTIAFGAFYQYVAVKFLEMKHASGYLLAKFYPKVLYEHPGIIYGFMMVSFLAGATLLVITTHQGLK